jgi:hypothetical protein
LLVAGALLPVLVGLDAARAQAPAAVRRIGMLAGVSLSRAAPWIEAFRDGLREREWIEGRNINIEYRFAEVSVGTILVPTRTAADNIVEGYSVSDKLPAREVCNMRLVGTLRFAHPRSLKTAKVLGIRFPQAVLVRADKVIE